MKNGKILVGMSGGLDSTYTVSLLREAGCEVIGAALIFSEHTDIEGARRAASELGIPLYERHVESLFKEKVEGNFAFCYQNGMTPNPCVVCNRYVKMQTLYEMASELGCDGFATGHYATPVRTEEGRYAIAMSSDRKKDQSYMLWGMTQEQIAHFTAPLSTLEKSEIRERAAAAGLSAAKTKESQDICFIPDGDYVSFLAEHYGRDKGFSRGSYIDREGKILGEHQGLVNYTVGQRKGLGIALGKPAFVTDMDPEANTVTLSFAENCYFDRITVEGLVFQALAPMEGELDCQVKIRYAAPPVECHVKLTGGRAEVTFQEPQRTPAPGQSAVFYSDGVIQFGGIIKRG